MNRFKYLMLITLLHASNTLVAMNALKNKQLAVANEQPQHTIEKSAEEKKPNNALITQNKTPGPAEKIAIKNKLINLLIEQLKYDTTLDGQIPNNTINYADKIRKEASVIMRDPGRSREFYTLTYLLYQTLENLKENKTINDNDYKALDENFNFFYSLRNSWWGRTQPEYVPKTLKELQELINKNIPELEIDNLIGYYFEFFAEDQPKWLKNNILKSGITLGEYFGNQFAEYYLNKREMYCSQKVEKSETRPPESLKPLVDNISLDDAYALVQANEAYKLFGLPQNYGTNYLNTYKEALNSRYKRLALKFHPDKYLEKAEKDKAESVFKAIGMIKDSIP